MWQQKITLNCGKRKIVAEGGCDASRMIVVLILSYTFLIHNYLANLKLYAQFRKIGLHSIGELDHRG